MIFILKRSHLIFVTTTQPALVFLFRACVPHIDDDGFLISSHAFCLFRVLCLLWYHICMLSLLLIYILGYNTFSQWLLDKSIIYVYIFIYLKCLFDWATQPSRMESVNVCGIFLNLERIVVLWESVWPIRTSFQTQKENQCIEGDYPNFIFWSTPLNTIQPQVFHIFDSNSVFVVELMLFQYCVD